MGHAARFLVALRLLDPDGTVSLTALALYVVLVKLAVAPGPSVVELGGLFVALLAHNAKKLLSHRRATEAQELRAELKALSEKHDKLATALALGSGKKF